MMLIEETSVPDEALPVAEFKAHLRLGTGFGDDDVQDAVLTSFLRAAMAAVEARTGKILLLREFSWTLTAWRDATGQALPIAPVTDVVEIVLTDDLGTETTVDPTRYRLERDHQRPRIVPAGGTLPSVSEGGEVEISFNAGFAATFGDLPADLAQAVFMLAAHYYENRSDIGMTGAAMPYGVNVLIERYKTVRLAANGPLQ
ncbi:MAG: head-tail connector protein [Pseudomonadota bacterium]